MDKRIRVATIALLLYLFLVQSLPDGIKNMTSLYKMTTADLPVMFTYNYYFSFLEIPIIIIGFILYKKSRVIRFFPIFLLIIAINAVFILARNEMNIVSIQSYEMFLLLLTGFSSASIILYFAKDLNDIETILDCFVILQFLLQIVSMISGASGEEGRYSAIGMGTGATATLAAEYMIWSFFSRSSRINWAPFFCALITLMLTGSRSNILAFLIVSAILCIKIFHKQVQKGNSALLFYTFYIAIPLSLVFLVILSRQNSEAFDFFSRVYQLFQGDVGTNFSTDSSFLGRQTAFEGGLQILREHPLGIPFSIYAIEYYSADFFSMEYPHSSLVCYTLLWTPFVMFFCMLFLIRLTVKCFKLRLDDAFYLLYIIFMIVFYGSPILYSKTYTIEFIILSYIALKVKTSSKDKEENVDSVEQPCSMEALS